MKAVVLHGREDARLEEVELPRPGPGEVLLRTRAALTCGTDVKVFQRGYHARMIRPPSLFGHEVAGVVEELGAGVEGLEPGDRVVAANSAPCGSCGYCGAGRASLCDDLLFWNGAYAEFACIPARIVARNLLPLAPEVPFRHAALVEPLACVVRGIEASGVSRGQEVAVIGAGPVGLMLLALARLRGASVVVVGRNGDRLRRAAALGAAGLIDASLEPDVPGRLRAMAGDGAGPSVVIDAVGLPETAEAALQAVRKGGLVNLFAGCAADARPRLDAQRLHYEELTLLSSFHHTPDSIRTALGLIGNGRIPVDDFVTGEAPLADVPRVLRERARGGDGLKTAILPWGE